MDIKLNKLAFKNFKGIKELEIDFSKTTNIYGENATGKTSIFDGFCWLLFDKDSKGRSKFEVQTLDKNNNVLHGIDCNVTAIINVDGVDKTISKTLSEKWVKQRGETESELKGTTTVYEIDGVPTKLKDYQTFINSIINEDLFKMITNPIYFPTMKWQDQRKILLDIIKEPEEESVINYNPSLSPLRDLLQDGIDNFNKRIKSSISKLKEQVKSIPFRIDECNNSIVEVDTEALEFRKRGIQGGINSIDEQIADSSKANEEKIQLQDKLFVLKGKEGELKLAAEKEQDKPLLEIDKSINGKLDTIKTIEQMITNNNFKIKGFNESKDHFENQITRKTDKQKTLREEWEVANLEKFNFDESKTICPCCARPYELDKIEEIKSNAENKFNESKKKRLSDIVSSGKALGEEIVEFKAKLPELQNNIDDIKNKTTEYEIKIKELKDEISILEKQKEGLSNPTKIEIPGLNEIQQEINEIQAQIDNFMSKDNTELKNKKTSLQEELEAINKQLNAKDNNEKLLTRIEELKQEEKDLNVKIAELEGQQCLGEEYIRTKVELLEGEINRKFNGAVAFKLFNQQVNGGLSECCEALVDGVPFGNANTAGQINAGLSIIKTLCEYYNVQAPIFIDNRESVNNIVAFEGQIINLKVSKDKKLNVEVQE